MTIDESDHRVPIGAGQQLFDIPSILTAARVELQQDHWRSVAMRPGWPAPVAPASGERGPRVRNAQAARFTKRLEITVTEPEGELDPRLR